MSQQPFNSQPAQDPRPSHGSSSSSYTYSTSFPPHTGGDGRYPADGYYRPPQYSHPAHIHGPINPYPYYPPMPPPPSSAEFPAYNYGQTPSFNYGYQPPMLPPPSASAHLQVPPPVAPPASAYPTPLVSHHKASSKPSTRNPNNTQKAVSDSDRSRPTYGDARYVPPLKPRSRLNEHEGKKVLYMPHMLFKSEGPHFSILQANDAPLPPGNRGWSEFPFSNERIPMEWIEKGYMTDTCLPTLFAERLSKGHTRPRPSVETFPQRNLDCKELLRCNELWTNARAYIQPTRHHTANSSASIGSRSQSSHQQFTTWDLATTFTNMATAEGQATAVNKLRSWFERLGYSYERTVNSEKKLEDLLFNENILTPLDYLLQTRYCPLESKFNKFSSADCYPCWSRTNCEVHQEKLYTEKGNRSHAGEPDFGLYPIKGYRVCSNVLEVKTWGSYTNTDITNIFTNTVAPGGRFQWTRHGHGPRSPYDICFALVKQIWAELVVCDADFGFCSNGKVVFLYIRTGAHQLTCSTVEDITSGGVLETLFGFSCASIDTFLAQKAGHDRSVIDLLAPPGQRRSNWTPCTPNLRRM